MPIKLKSGFSIQTKHQNVKNGLVLETDLSTMVNMTNIVPDQVPVYQSGNLVVTKNPTQNYRKNYKTKAWADSIDGSEWTEETVQKYIADVDSCDRTQRLKVNYSKLQDFAYYGSCAELLRASIDTIINTFPGELYGKEGRPLYLDPRFYDKDVTPFPLVYDNRQFPSWISASDPVVDKPLDNPFGIDLHTADPDREVVAANPLKFFAYMGFNNYVGIFMDGLGEKEHEISDWRVIKVNNEKPCVPGTVVAKIQLDFTGGKSAIILYIYMGAGEYAYMYGSNDLGTLHLRPKASYLTEFFDSLPPFEHKLLDPDTYPKYTATFEVENEIDNGVMISYETFTFPVTEGGYNIDIVGSAFDLYISKLSRLGMMYDERLSDNLYRSMTHESIKNLDWTNGNEEITEKYAPGLDKIKKVLRIIGRCFDEVKAYIDGIGQSDTVTYSDNNGMTNYALSDALNVKGWDICSIKPYFAQWYEAATGEAVSQEDALQDRKICDSGVTTNYAIGFSQDDYIYHPYNNEAKGVFMCCDKASEANDGETERLISDKYVVYNGKRLFFDCDDILRIQYEGDEDVTEIPYNADGVELQCVEDGEMVTRKYDVLVERRLENVILPFSDQAEWGSNKINYEFLRRFMLNSSSILAKKGTIAGIEELLGLFGLVSKRFITKSEYPYNYGRDDDGNPIYVDGYNETFDYMIQEESVLTQPIQDATSLKKDLMDIDWYNSTKTYRYNSLAARHGVYESYRGLPVRYINYYTDGTGTTTEQYDASGNSRTFAYRKLYPFFDKNIEHDGGMYYQMYGGWLTQGPYTISKYGEILCGDIFTETLRNIYEVTYPTDLVTIPINQVRDEFYVEVENNSVPFVIINGVAYDIKTESVKVGSSYSACSYIEVAISNVGLLLGHSEFNSGHLLVSNPCYDNWTRDVDYTKYDRERLVKVYLYKVVGSAKKPFNVNGEVNAGDVVGITLLDSERSADTANNIVFMYVSGDDSYSKYWFLNEREYAYKFRMDVDPSYGEYIMSLYQDGWYRIDADDPIAKYLDAIETVKISNNPHSAKLPYDDGVEYLLRYVQLFKQPLAEGAFNEECYEDGIVDTTAIEPIGFLNIVDEETGAINVLRDDKVHGFYHHWREGQSGLRYGADGNELKDVTRVLMFRDTNSVTYGDNDVWSDLEDSSIDCIINTKYVELIFNVYLTDIERYKYFHDVVMKYLEQVLPSTIICRVTYDNTAIYDEAVGDYYAAAPDNQLTMEVGNTFIVR